MARRGGRFLSALPLLMMVVAVALGCWWMATHGAPRSFAAINAASALVALGLSLVRPPRWAMLAALALAPSLAAIAILFGPAIDGVHRWIGVGDLRLHAVMLAGPAFAVALARRRGALPALATALLAGLVAWQPDFGTLLALCATLAALAPTRRDTPMLLALLASLALLVLGWANPDTLAPVSHVEGVAQVLWRTQAPVALAALAALALAIALPLRSGAPGTAFAAWHAGLVGASLIGPYPTPLIGYGASAILGYGLGWIILRRS